jgi:phosphatidylserine decarboxylase
VTRISTGLLLALLILATSTYADDTIVISDVWIAEAPPGAGVNAAYLLITNQGRHGIRLLSVSSPAFAKIEIHKNIIVNNIASMEYFAGIDIDAGQTLRFQPGDFHLMLYNGGDNIKAGNVITLSFTFADGIHLDTEAEVRKLSNLYHQHTHEHELTTGLTMLDRIKVNYQYLLPQHFLSGLAYRLTRITWAPLKNQMISTFIKMYNVDMSIATQPDPHAYRHFNDFFTRALIPSARPINEAANIIVSPVDGAVSQAGRINADKILQAKGRNYSAKALLGGDQQLADSFADGDFITIYLSPKDYHRIHMPLTGQLQSMTYVPGDLFSVNRTTTAGLDNLFARNERVIQIFDTEIGKMALIMVGAIFVGSMETVWAGEITPSTERKLSTTYYDSSGNTAVRLSKGAEMGRFNMGSTVILLFEKNRLQWDFSMQADKEVILGQKIAEFK